MNIRKMPKEDLELLSYADIAYEILKQDNKKYSTPDLFKEVCALLDISEEEMYEMIGDFYTNLTTDKRFLLLDDAKWDLKEHHIVKTIIDDDEEDDEIAQEQEEIAEEAEDDAIMTDSDEYDDDDDSDDLDDLEIVTEEDLEE